MSESPTPDSERPGPDAAPLGTSRAPASKPLPREIGGRTSGLEPTRYGDWEKDGRCIDF